MNWARTKLDRALGSGVVWSIEDMFFAFIFFVLTGGGLWWFFNSQPKPDKKPPLPAAQVKRDRFKGAIETDLRTRRTKPGENPQFGRR